MAYATQTEATSPGDAVPQAGVNPNSLPLDEVMAASFPTMEAAEKAVVSLADAGVSGEHVTVHAEQREKYDLLKKYLHRDSDRHRHAGVGMVFFACAGLGVAAFLTLVFVNPLQSGWIGAIAIGLIGGLVGAVIGGLLGGYALRSADDKSVELVERISRGGPLVVVRRRTDAHGIPFEEIGRVLVREGGRTIRLGRRPIQAARHPGDTRSPGVTEPLHHRPSVAYDSVDEAQRPTGLPR